MKPMIDWPRTPSISLCHCEVPKNKFLFSGVMLLAVPCWGTEQASQNTFSPSLILKYSTGAVIVTILSQSRQISRMDLV